MPSSSRHPGWGDPPADASPESAPPTDGGSRAGSLWEDLGSAVGVEKPDDSGQPETVSSAEPAPADDGRVDEDRLDEERVGEDRVGEDEAGEDGLGPDRVDADTWSPEDEAVHQAEEAVLADVATLAAERDDYLDQLQRLKADFDNYRKRVLRQQTEHLERAAEALVEKLLDVLDTFDAALAHGEGFNQVHGTLVGLLEKEGLERIDPAGEPFNPQEADAVAHEEGDGGPTVTDVLRPGYRWKGRVLRPAMVRVRG